MNFDIIAFFDCVESAEAAARRIKTYFPETPSISICKTNRGFKSKPITYYEPGRDALSLSRGNAKDGGKFYPNVEFAKDIDFAGEATYSDECALIITTHSLLTEKTRNILRNEGGYSVITTLHNHSKFHFS